MDRAAIDSPPLPDALVPAWREILDAWQAEQRKPAFNRANDFVDRLDQEPAEAQQTFARWLCEQFFDKTIAWTGVSHCRATGVFERPLEGALSLFPLVTRVIVPHLEWELRHPTGQSERWLYQTMIRLEPSLPPDYQQWIETLGQWVCGPEIDPLLVGVTVLRMAAESDAVARRWLTDAEQYEPAPDDCDPGFRWNHPLVMPFEV